MNISKAQSPQGKEAESLDLFFFPFLRKLHIGLLLDGNILEHDIHTVNISKAISPQGEKAKMLDFHIGVLLDRNILEYEIILIHTPHRSVIR